MEKASAEQPLTHDYLYSWAVFMLTISKHSSMLIEREFKVAMVEFGRKFSQILMPLVAHQLTCRNRKSSSKIALNFLLCQVRELWLSLLHVIQCRGWIVMLNHGNHFQIWLLGLLGAIPPGPRWHGPTCQKELGNGAPPGYLRCHPGDAAPC